MSFIYFYQSVLVDDKTCPEDCSEMIDENMYSFNRKHNSANSHKQRIMK